jgi:hypothetical protein
MSSSYFITIREQLYVKPCFERQEDCFNQGRAAYSQAYRQDQNPYAPSTLQHECWDGGWLDEQDEATGT